MRIKNPRVVGESSEGGLSPGPSRPGERRAYITRERTIEAALRRAVERRGGLCIKFVSPGCKGVPDRVVLLPGAPAAFVEVKRPGEVPTALQRYRHAEMRRAGALVHVVDSLDAVDAFLAAAVRAPGGA